MTIQRVAIFCGSSLGADPIYAKTAEQFALAMANANLDLVYGGARIGLMGVLADTALAQGRAVFGVIPKDLAAVEIAHEQLTEQHIVNNMHERKAKIFSLSDAFVLLPGGLAHWMNFLKFSLGFNWAFTKNPVPYSISMVIMIIYWLSCSTPSRVSSYKRLMCKAL